MNRYRSAFHDIFLALVRFPVWKSLGVLDVKQRYQRSVLGPWWISISMLIFIVVLGVVFSRVFSVNYSEYIPYFSAGYLLWVFISSCVNESTDLFRQNSGFIKQIRLPYSLYIFKFLTKNILLFFHNLLVYLIIVVYFKIPLGWSVLLAVPGFLFLVINLYWICLVVSLISTRYRDMVPIVNSCVQMLFFVTPISWNRQILDAQSKIIKLNPLTYFMDIVRDPLLGHLPPLNSWFVVMGITSVGLVFSFIIFSKVRSRIPFWVD